jgi:hypothetical protein
MHQRWCPSAEWKQQRQDTWQDIYQYSERQGRHGATLQSVTRHSHFNHYNNNNKALVVYSIRFAHPRAAPLADIL